MAYAEYPIEHMDIRSLHLDVSNYRFAADQPSEMAALNYLWAEEGVREVAELILRDGYVDIEQPLVAHEDGRYVVLEGNRRVSALRVLNDPTLAPAHQIDVERLLRRFALEAEDLPQSIRVMVVPSRAAAAPVLARLHIGISKKRWDLDEQAKFVIAQLGEGVTIEQLSADLPAIESVPRVVRMGRVRERLRTTVFSDDAIAKYAVGSRLKMSAFEYAYRQTAIQRLIGLAFDDQSSVESWATDPPQLFALERLITGFKTGELNTRRGLKPGTPEFERLLREMRNVSDPVDAETNGESASHGGEDPGDETASTTDETSPSDPASDAAAQPGEANENTDEHDSVSSTDGSNPPANEAVDDDHRTTEGEDASEPPVGLSTDATRDGDENNDDSAQSGRRGPNDPLLRVNLQLTGIDELSFPVTMQRRLRELRRINVNEFPAAAAMLMRSTIEAAIKEHYGQANGIDAVGELGSVMRNVRRDYQSNGQLSNSINNVGRFSNDATHVPGTGRWFNMISHSVNVDVSGPDVQKAWLVVLPLVRFMLNESPRATQASEPDA